MFGILSQTLLRMKVLNNELTESLTEPPSDAPSTQPLLREMMADIRELKANSVTKAEFAYLLNIVERIEMELTKINAHLEGIERERQLTHLELETIGGKQYRQDARLIALEQDVEAIQKIAA